MAIFECDCGRSYYSSDAVLNCQNANHYLVNHYQSISITADLEFLHRLRDANLTRLEKYGHGALHDPNGWGPMQWGCAAAGEMGELCNLLKKYERQAPTDPKPDDLCIEIAKEIADVIIYLDILAAYFQFDLTRIIQTKFNRDSKKRGFPERL